MSNVEQTGTSKLKQKLSWIFIGKRLLLSDDNTLICPRCSSKLDKIKKNEIVIDVCPFCQGMWLDDGEIEKLSKLNKKVKKNGEKK
ncbi:MAG: zf-TFIIB domain-containing protein [Nanoarchaeota archaeon]|nr:zf-TFIIB domain-containing protein [Nanoarchaeota archaeon]